VSVQIERGAAPIREIIADDSIRSGDTVSIAVETDGEISFSIRHYRFPSSRPHLTADCPTILLSREDSDTLLQALAEIRGDLATRPF
jgi:hypothetical protein